MSIRLTTSHRERMAKALVTHKLHGRAEALMVESSALFNAVLDERYDAATQKLMRQLEKRHPGAFDVKDSLYLRAQGMRVTVGRYTIGSHSSVNWTADTSPRPVLRSTEDAEPSAALAARIAAHALATQKFTEDVKEAYRKALGTLGQFTTSKRLVEEWPEAIPVIGKFIALEERTLPVVQLAAINDEFDLPPAELQAA